MSYKTKVLVSVKTESYHPCCYKWHS